MVTVRSSEPSIWAAVRVFRKAGPRELSFSGRDYLFNFVIPNLYFHLMATYAILRHNGVDVGKMDFLGAV